MPDTPRYNIDFQPTAIKQLVKSPARKPRGFVQRGEFKEGRLYSGSDMQGGISVVTDPVDGAVWLARKSGVLPQPGSDNSWLLLTHHPREAKMPDWDKASKRFTQKLESEWEQLTARSLVRTLNDQTAAVDDWFQTQIESGGFDID